MKERKFDPTNMTFREEKEMISIIQKYKFDEVYRRKVNSVDFELLTEIEKLALKGLTVSEEGIEVINNDMSNYYEELNTINVQDEVGIINTCMNMAIARFLYFAFKSPNIKRLDSYNLEEIKTRTKGGMFSAMDKPIIIKLIKDYNKKEPKYFSEKANKYYEMYIDHIRHGFGTDIFENLAFSFNSNIYLHELMEEKVENNKKRKLFR